MRSHRSPHLRQAPSSAFAGCRFPPEVITLAVRWYLRFGLSYRDVEELLAERGIEVDHVSIYRWVQRFASEFVEAARARQHIVGDRWHVDETYLKVGGTWRYLFRAIDQFGQVIDVFLSPRRDAKTARRFFERAIDRTRISPVEVTTDRYRVYPRVLDELLPAAFHDTEVHANNPIETDHGRLKARIRPFARAEARPYRQGDRRRPCLHPERPPGLLRSRDRRAAHYSACRSVRRTGPRDLTSTQVDRSTSPWLQLTQQRPSTGYGVGGFLTTGTGVFGQTDSSGIAMWGRALGGGTDGVLGEVDGGNGWGVKGTTAQATSVGILAQNTGGGVALQISGTAVFSRSGLAMVPAGTKTATVTGISLTTASLLFAMVQVSGGIFVKTAVPNISGSSFTITLSKATTVGIPVAWFVVN